MLKDLDPLLTPDLLHALASMGHGDTVALVDAHFPASAIASHTVSGRPVRLDGADCTAASRAILSLLPLDTFTDEPIRRMQVVGSPDEVTEVQQEVRHVAVRAEGRDVAMGSLERFAFYEAARGAYAVVITGETRPYGCFLLTKGVVGV